MPTLQEMEANQIELRSAVKKNKYYVILYSVVLFISGYYCNAVVRQNFDALTPKVPEGQTVSSYVTPFNAPTDRETITKRFEEKYLSGWNGSCPHLVSAVKKQLNDPSSFEHVETRYAYDAESNCMLLVMKYRAKNAMGALVLSAIDAKVSLDGKVLSIATAQ